MSRIVHHLPEFDAVRAKMRGLPDKYIELLTD